MHWMRAGCVVLVGSHSALSGQRTMHHGREVWHLLAGRVAGGCKPCDTNSHAL